MYPSVCPMRSVTLCALILSLLSMSPHAVAASRYYSSVAISGTPATSVFAGSAYSFQPSTSGGWRYSYRTFTITNKPAWATFSSSTGKLSGTPTAAQVGTYSNIVIRVTDRFTSAQLPAFTVAVKSPAIATNRVPMIGGTPSSQVLAGVGYNFKPTATDADGDKLTFALANKPAWASFDTATGTLGGTPTAAQVGTYSNLALSVSDGRGGTAALPAFSVAVVQNANGRVTISWVPPTQNTDGTALTNLAGYSIRYGTISGGPYAGVVTLTNPSLSSYLVENLTPGTYYFVLTARNIAGVESAYSAQASKIIN